MAIRPKIDRFCYTTPEGNPGQFIAGANCSEIREVEEGAEYCYIPWLEVYDGENLLARFNQHKVEHIFYAAAREVDVYIDWLREQFQKRCRQGKRD
jgi:hypothetical protein